MDEHDNDHPAPPSDPVLWNAHLVLESVLNEALHDDRIIAALGAEQLRIDQAREVVLRDESVIARVLVEQQQAARTNRRPPRSTSRPVSPAQAGWLLGTALAGIGYIGLLRAAWTRLPLPYQLLAVAGLVSILALSGLIIMRRAPGVLGVPAHHELGDTVPHGDTIVADRRLVLTEIVLPALREYVRNNRTLQFGTALTYRAVDGLYDEDAANIVRTGAAAKLRRIVERADSGAVALAGHRGAGKTTSIRSMEHGVLHDPEAQPPLVVVASAPAHYEPRDFVLHLHALLCNAVRARAGAALGHRARFRVPLGRPSRRGLRRFIGVALLVACGLAVANLLWRTDPGRFAADLGELATTATADLPGSLSVLWSGQPLGRVLALGIVVIVALRVLGVLAVATLRAGFVLSGNGLSRIAALVRLGTTRELVKLRREADRQLDRIRFLQTHTAGWSGKLSMPLRGAAERTWSTQRAEQQLTHPEVVDKFRAFAEHSAATLTACGVTDRVVIAIDELDKIGEPEKAHQFVNDIKGVFGVPGCLFFVSVSDDAVLNFEQRGLAVRDAFDSAFSDLVRLEEFTLDESRLWIALRLAGIPEQFCYLCHCLSGGLPRDLRRFAVAMVDVASSVYQPSLATVAGTLVHDELAGKVHAFTAEAATIRRGPELNRLLSDLLLIPGTRAPLELAWLAHRLVHADDGTGEDTDTGDTGTADDIAAIRRLRWHSGCFVLFCATVLEIFDDGLSGDRLGPELHELAVAQRQMASYPELAWQLLLDFRKSNDLDPQTATAPAGTPHDPAAGNADA